MRRRTFLKGGASLAAMAAAGTAPQFRTGCTYDAGFVTKTGNDVNVLVA